MTVLSRFYSRQHSATSARWRTGIFCTALGLLSAHLSTAEATDTVSAPGPLVLHLSTAAAPRSINSNTVTLLGPSGPVANSVRLSSDSMAVEILPRSDLVPGSTYTAFVDGAQSSDGHLLTMQTAQFEVPRVATPGSLANANSTMSNRLRTGSDAAMAGFQAACEPTVAAIRSFTFCHEAWNVEGGVFRVGRANFKARWRTNIEEPELAAESDLPAGSLPHGATSVFGTVLRIDDHPLSHVTVSIGDRSAQTDPAGHFVLTGIPAGQQKLLVDGTSANSTSEEYGDFYVALNVQEGVANPVPFNMFIPRISAIDRVEIAAPTVTETVITHPAMPGLEIHVPPNTVFRDRNGHVLTKIAIVPTPVDRSPVPLPANFPVYFTMEPGTATVETTDDANGAGISIVYPNYDDGPASKEYPFYAYDVERGGWQIYAIGVPTSDGSAIKTQTNRVGPLRIMPAGFASGSTQSNPNPHKCLTCPPFPAHVPPPPIISTKTADPVDASTGVFVHPVNDLQVNDVEPISFGHNYRSDTPSVYSFGQGMLHSYGDYLYNPAGCTHQPSELDFIDSLGHTYAFFNTAASPGIYTHTATPTRFYGAHIYTLPGAVTDQAWVELRDGETYVFSNGCPNQLIWKGRSSGQGLSFVYTAGLLTKIISENGRYIALSYNASNFISQARDHTGRTINYTYTGNQLTEVDYPDSTSEKYSYDTNGNMLTVVDRRGNTVTTNQYDANQRVKKQTLVDSAVWQFSYTLSGSSVTATDVTRPNNEVDHYTFDSAGYPLTLVRANGTPLAQTTTNVRGQQELVTSATDSFGRTTTVSYDAWGDPLTVTYLYGTISAVTYTYTYTADFHKIATAKDPLGHTTTYGYDANGCLTSLKDALSHTTTLTCNSAVQPLTVKDAFSHTTTFGYNNGDLYQVSDALSHMTTYTTDELGRVTAVSDPLGRITRMTYDTNDRVQTSTDALNQTTNYTYDGNGNLTDVVDPNGGHTKYGYDGRDRRNSRTDALNNGESWTYDGESNALTYTDRKSQVTHYQYDVLNRPSLITYHDGNTVTPTFDTANRLTTVVDTVSGTINRNYDGLNNLLQEQTPQGTVNYTYDTASRRATMTPGSQTQIVYGFDNADRLTTITQGTQVVTIGYDNANRRTSLTLPNGVVTSYGYDNADELTTLTYKNSSGTTFGSIGYSYDAAGQRLTRSLTGLGSDLLPTSNTGTNTFNLNNQQTVWNSFALGYDLNGDPNSNASTSPSTTYIFDVRHRLTQIQQGASTIASFQYDTFGRRTQKTIGSTSTSFLYDGQNGVQETSGATNYSILTGLGIDERYARVEAAGARYFFTDVLNSTIALTDSSQTVQATYSYEPFGEVTATGTSDNSYQYTGRENDGTGLYYYRARYYSPAMKRFISEDPMGLAAGLNEYAYVSGKPTRLRDPRGLNGWDGLCPAGSCNPYFPPPLPPDPCDCDDPPENCRLPNGNMNPTFQPQDGVCSVPMDFLNGSPAQVCCFVHDVCYTAYKCNKSSWGASSSTDCGQCNQTVEACVSNNLQNGYPGPPPNPDWIKNYAQ
jgi:RHS repeat-associated protein